MNITNTDTPENTNLSGFSKIEETSNGVSVPEKIIKSVAAARTIYTRFRTNHLHRMALYKEIEGLIQGNPPYNPAELRSAGLQHVTNFNDMSANAVIERACLAYWNLLHNSETMVSFIFRGATGKDPSAPFYAKLLAKHFDYAIRKYWPAFRTNLASLASQLVKLGVSPVIFPSPRSPKWNVVELNRFFIPDQTSSDVETLSTVFVETDFTIQYLHGVLKKFKDKKQDEHPWNIDQLAKILTWFSGPNTNQVNPADAVELQKKVLSGDIGFDSQYDQRIRLVSLLQVEYNGKVSHYMFHRDHTPAVPATGVPEDEFVYYAHEQYKSMQEALVIFTMNPGQATIHANRGLGHKIFSLAQAKIQLDCSVVDMGKWASTPIVKSSSLNSKDADQIRFYPGVPTNIGTAELLQNNLGANVEKVVTAAEYMASLIQFNISYSGSDPASPDPDTGSQAPSQTRLLATREFSVLKNFILHYYENVDKVVQIMVNTIIHLKETDPDHKIYACWKKRCIADGVPAKLFDMIENAEKDELPDWMDVSATRAAGSGSQVALLIALEALQPYAGSMGPREEKEFKRLLITALIGHEHVSSFMQESDDVDEMAGGASLAGVENAIMQTGKSPVFSPDNEHRSHLATHIALGTSIIQGVQQGQMDVIEADSVFNVLVPHLEEHANAASRSMFAQAFMDKVKVPLDQIKRYAMLNRRNAAKALQAKAEEQRENQEQTDNVMNDEQRKTFQVVNEERRKDMKLEAQSERQERAGTAKERALEKKTDSDIAIKSKKAQGEVEIKRISEGLKNNANEVADSNPSEYLQGVNGVTPSPFDIEGGGTPNA